jgi:hypothetical protein
MPNDSLKKLYVDELKDLYGAENQLVPVPNQKVWNTVSFPVLVSLNTTADGP